MLLRTDTSLLNVEVETLSNCIPSKVSDIKIINARTSLNPKPCNVSLGSPAGDIDGRSREDGSLQEEVALLPSENLRLRIQGWHTTKASAENRIRASLGGIGFGRGLGLSACFVG